MCEENISQEKLLREKIHQLNNHLFAASGRVELLVSQEGLSEQTKESLNKISSELEKIRCLVEEMHKCIKK
ncbi:MAG: hypothetical protein PHN59_02130 [Candidatus Omnitrophica bacterium]|nr:hypothetical protein [Candidatus Omnitrophota bacterium]